MTEKKVPKLPPIQNLFQESWKLFQKTWMQYLKLIGLGIAFLFLGALIGILISLPITFIAVGSHFQIFRHLTLFNSVLLVLLALWAILYLLSLIAMGIIFPIVSILILQGKKALSLFDLIKQSKKFFWSYFLITLLTGLVVFGGMILLVIPGLVMEFLFAFFIYEIVLDNQSGMQAMQRSYFMVKAHFWGVLGRLLLMALGIWIISVMLGLITRGDVLLRLVVFLFSLASMWFARAYIFVLYKQLREKTIFPQHISLRWIWIVSGIGWLLIILLMVALIVGVAHLPAMQPSHMQRIPRGAV